MYEQLNESDESDDFDDWDYPDEPDSDLDNADYLPCPECGEDVFDDAEQCPHCGQYITFSTNPWSGRSPAWIVIGALGVIAVIVTLLAL
jgi:RNA polymerase subunit RPABC4/transcription elongation factor Spt4